MGISISGYIIDGTDNATLVAAAGTAIDTKPLAKINSRDTENIYNIGFLQRLNSIVTHADKTTSSADIPDSVDEDFDVIARIIDDVKFANGINANAAVYRRNCDAPFTIRTDIGMRRVFSRVSFSGHGAYDAASKFSQIVGPGRVIIVNEQTGDSFSGTEFESFMALGVL